MIQSYGSSSTGQAFTSTDHLDVHFEANRDAYAGLLSQAGLQPGWHVLDAGAGGGNYIPLIADHVGEAGRITAIDLAPENVDTIKQRITTWKLDCPVEAVQGSVLNPPFETDQFDAVWCANTSQYLSDEELDTALAEFHRVTKRGGLVAIKEHDGSSAQLRPSNPAWLWRAHDRWKLWERYPGPWRSWNLNRFIEGAGLVDVWSQRSLIEYRAPFTPFEQQYLKQFWRDFVARLYVEVAEQAGVKGEELKFWIDLRDDTPASVLNRPDSYSSEGQALAVGRVPEEREISS